MLITPKHADDSITHTDMLPKNVLVIYRLGDDVGQAIAEYYQNARSIPADNVHAYDSPWTDSSTLTTRTSMEDMCEWLAAKQEAMDTKAIALCGHWPGKGDGTSNNSIVFDHFVACSYYYYHTPAKRFNSSYFNRVGLDDYSSTNKEAPYNGVSYKSDVSDRTTFSRVSIPDNVLKTYVFAGGYDIPCVPVFRLDCSEVFPSSDARIPEPSRFNYVKRMIDDAIAVEQAEYADVGVVLAGSSGTDTMTVGLPTRDIADSLPNKGVYFEAAANEPDSIQRNINLLSNKEGSIWLTVTGTHFMQILSVGGTNGWTHATVEPTWDTAKLGNETVDGDITFRYVGTRPASVFPAGATTFTPHHKSRTFLPIDDVFFSSVGPTAYVSNCDKPELHGDYVYRQGAIMSWGHSCGAAPWPNEATDWEFNDSVLINVQASADALTEAKGLYITNGNGISKPWAYLKHDGTGSPIAAEVETTSTQVIFYEDNGVGLTEVGRITVISGVTLEDKFDLLVAGAPVNWEVTVSPSACAAKCESRAMTSIKNGACIAFGSQSEPLTSGAPKNTTLLSTLWHGSCIAEAVYDGASALSGMNANAMIFGDPLYRPFGHHR